MKDEKRENQLNYLGRKVLNNKEPYSGVNR